MKCYLINPFIPSLSWAIFSFQNMPYFVINQTFLQEIGQEVYTYCCRLRHRLRFAVTFQPVDGCHSNGTAPRSKICREYVFLAVLSGVLPPKWVVKDTFLLEHVNLTLFCQNDQSHVTHVYY